MSDDREDNVPETTAGATHLSPKMIYDKMSEKIIGQNDSKRVVANALFLHYVRYLQSMLENKTDLKKSNVILMGPTGCGKTYIVREGIKAIQTITGYPICPLLEVDCTELTPRGWEGEDISGRLKDHYKEHGDNEATFNTSVVFLDEFDKLCKPAIGRGGDHNRNTQYNLLKVMEGCNITSKEGGLMAVDRTFNTSKMLFILAGNFSEVRQNRTKKTIGYHELTETISDDKRDIHSELERAGVATQIVGRCPFVTELNRLSKDELKEILLTQLLPEYVDTWAFMGKDLDLEDSAIDNLVEKCYNRKTGARGLQADLAKHLEENLFDTEFKL